MTNSTKRTMSPHANKRDPKPASARPQPDKHKAETMAHASLRPTVQTAFTLIEYNKNFGNLSLKTLVDELAKQCALASQGNLERSEAMLTTQAHALDAIFHTLARRAQRAELVSQFDLNLRLALKAQSQCRATLETLATMKYPQPVAFVRQANIANGPQQINNRSTQSDASFDARESRNRQNKLLEEQRGEELDRGTSGTASRANSELETVEPIDRSENP